MLAVMMGVLLLAAPMFSQTANGRISGTVKDQTGGAIVGAAVVVTDVARGLTRNLTTDDAGAYLAPNLLPGNYTVRATFTGFQAWERTNIALGVGGDLFIDVVLQPGAQTTTVTITEELPLVNTTSSTLGGALSNETINDLPISGRNFIMLMDLRPGVVLTLGNDSGGAGSASVNGLRPENSNEYLVEGLHAMDAYTGQSVMNNIALRGDSTAPLSTDAIQEFNQQFNSKAEYGYRAGGATNIGLKSGTNALHGTGFAIFRERKLDARNYFNDNRTSTQPDANNSMQQFGATFGGPIKQDKLFFFLSYEQQNLVFGNPASTSVAFTDTALIAGFPGCIATSTCTMVSNSIAGSRTPTTGMHLITACLGLPAASRSPQSLSMVGLNPDCSPGSTYPNATNGTTWFVAHGNDHGAPSDINQNIQSYFPNTQTNNRQIGSSAKIDYTLNEKNTINGFLFIGRGDNVSETARALPIWRTHVTVRPLVVAGTWTFLPNSAWANSLRVGYAKSDQLFSPQDEELGLTAAQLGLNTGVVNYGDRNFGYPQSITLSGFNTIATRNTEVQGPETTLEIIDTLSYLVGSHSVKFGGGVMTSNQNGATWANTKGVFSFGGNAGSTTTASGVIAFLAGQNPVPTSILGDSFGDLSGTGFPSQGLQSATLFYGDPTSHIRRATYSLYVQDDWRIRPRLTLNFGLRYDLTTVPADVDHIMGSFDPQAGIVQEGIQIPKVHNGDHNNFAPRVGFAWDMFGNGKTVLRAGGSIVYELPTLRHYAEVGNSPGITTPASAWVNGCTTGLTTPGANGIINANQIPANAVTNCGGALTTSGGTRNVGQVNWTASTNTLIGSVAWDYPAGAAVFPTSAINNCSPFIRVTEKINTSAAQNGRIGAQCPVVVADRHFVNPYTETWSLSLTHAILNNLVLDVAYVGNHGAKLIGRTDDNQAQPFQLWNSVVPSAGWVAGGCPNATANPLAVNLSANCSLPANTGGSGANALTPVSPGMTFAQVCVARPINNNCGNNTGSGLTSGAFGRLQPFNAKFPYISSITRIWNQDTSNYSGLQVTLTARNFHGLNLTTGYTWSHALDVVSGNGSGVGTDSYNTQLDYGRSGSDLRHKFTLSPSYTLPSVTGYYGLLEGWRLNGVFRYQSGRPWGPGRSGDYAGTGRTSRWDFFGNPDDFRFWSPDEAPAIFHPNGYDPAVTAGTVVGCSNSQALTTCVGTPNNNLNNQGQRIFTALGGTTVGSTNTCGQTGSCYTASDLAVNTAACTAHATTPTHLATLRTQGCWTRGSSVIMPPDLNSFGNMIKNVFDGPGYWNVDFSVAKRQKFTERFTGEFRAEAFNILNHPNFGNPSAGLGCSATGCSLGQRATSTPDVGATNPVLGSGGPRRFQLGLKILF